jgi:hypothetical protein
MQNELGFDPPTHPERSQEAHDEGAGRSSVMQEIVAETQAERNNRENESYFREQPPSKIRAQWILVLVISPLPCRM